MVLYVIIGALAAFGLVCVLWACLGWLLPGSTGTALVCAAESGGVEEAVIRRYRWLLDLGFLKTPLLLVRHGITPEEEEKLLRRYPGIEFCEPEELSSRLELEREKLG